MPASTLTMLVIDDEPQIRRVVRNALLNGTFGASGDADQPSRMLKKA